MDAVDALLDPWRSGIGVRALAEIVLVGALCGALGFWVTAYRLVYSTESLAHGLLPGLVLAALAGVPLLAGAAVGILAAAVLIELAGRDERVGPDTATAVVVTGMLGLGSLLALARERPQRLGELLFGDPLAAGAGDLAAAAALALLGGAALLALHRPLTAIAFDPRGAPALGLRAGVVRAALLALLAAAVCVATQGLGNLLVLAAVVAPPVAVSRHVRSAGAAMLGGALVAVAAGVAGLYASYHLELAAGASVALALCLAAAAGATLPARAQPGARPAVSGH
jgi:ABC-type Mn2+/Zn2+ transport system permease subunit